MQLCLETLCKYQIYELLNNEVNPTWLSIFCFLREIYKALGPYQSNGKYKYYNARELIKEVIQITMTA